MSTLNTYNLKSPDSANTNIALDASGNIAVRAGSAASPSIYITGDTNTGLYSPGADQVAISTNSTGRLFVDASGQVGIGRTPAASVALAVQGVKGITSLTSSTGTNATYHLFNNTGGNFYIGLDSSTGSDFGTTYAGVIWHGGAYPLVFANGNTERMRLDSSGRLGLGTSSPNTKLSVIGTTGAFADSSIRINGTAGTQSNNSGLWITGNQTTSHHNWLIGSQYNVNNAFEITPSTTVDGATFSTPAVVVTSAGRVGVGITSPSSLTHILQGTGGSDTLWAENGTSNNVIRLKAASASDNYVDSYTATSAGNLIIRPGGTETFRIDTAGRVLVGTSSSSDSTAMVLAGYNGGGSNLPAVLWMKRTENASTITADESLGLIRFGSSDSGYGASIDTYADATWSSTSDCPTRLVFSTTADGASSPTERMRITNSGQIWFNKTSNSFGVTGIQFRPGSSDSWFTTDATNVVALNRLTNDGTLLEFAQDSVVEGSVSVSGTTVSYNGAHLSRWSQLPSGQERTEILRGTVLANIDEMCEWGEEDNEQLNRMKVSDVEGDKNVSGVFQAWDDDDDTYTNDFYCAMTGDFIIRIGAGVTVERGDLLMSAGDGTAKPQGDGYVQDKTIAKVTSTNVSCTYDDGSYCVPCVLMAC